MAKRCVPEKRCGAEVGGWLNGPHPSVKEGEVNRTVCFQYGERCCLWRTTVKVRNCGKFFVYSLKRDVRGVYRKYRYCGNGEGSRRHFLSRNLFPKIQLKVLITDKLGNFSSEFFSAP